MKIHFFTLQFEYICYPCIYHVLVIQKLMAEFGRYSRSCHISLYNLRNLHSLLTPLVSSEKQLSIKGSSSSQWWIEVFRNHNFLLKAQILLLPANTVSGFFDVTASFHSFLKNVCQTSNSE